MLVYTGRVWSVAHGMTTVGEEGKLGGKSWRRTGLCVRNAFTWIWQGAMATTTSLFWRLPPLHSQDPFPWFAPTHDSYLVVNSGTAALATMGKRSNVAKFPVARIKKIMQADEDVGKVAQATPVVVCEYA